jgi:putative solute:sodium symporter small subunit
MHPERDLDREAAAGHRAPDPAVASALAAAARRHWRRNVQFSVLLLVLWAAAGLGCGVLLADVLHGVRLGGFPLGFWFAQQGSIVVFVLLILAYALGLALLDRAHRRERRRILAEAGR